MNNQIKTSQWQENIVGRPEQQEAITSVASLTVVSAGAGTGKTHTLAQRFAWLLATDPLLDVDNILVLTFTEKAAREMRERIKSTVEKWYDKFPKELAHLERSVKYIDDANISTIHSFAMRVIRESALALDVDPAASVIPAPKENLWWEKYAAALGTLSTKSLLPLLEGEWRARAVTLFSGDNFSAFVNEYSPKELAKASRNAAEVLGSAGATPEFLWWQDDENILADVETLRDFPFIVHDLWIRRVLPEIPGELLAKPGNSFQSLFELLDIYSGLEASEANCQIFCQSLFTEGLKNLPGNSKIKNVISEVLEEPLKDWRDREVRNFLKMKSPSKEERSVAELLNRVCALGWQCWDALRSGEGALSMNDLIRYAGEALEKMPTYGDRFRHLLIDEFQDTDRLQNRLVTLLWDEEKNTLFVVGDLKQSIYRFRHADLRIFQDYIEMARMGGNQKYKYVTLDRSYRTNGALLGAFNDIFGSLWADGLEKGTSMCYESLECPEDETWWEERNSVRLEPPLEICLAACGSLPDEEERIGNGEKDTPRSTRLRLLRRIAVRMYEIRRDGGKVWDKTGIVPAFRAITWSDFAILVPSRGVYPQIEKAFTESGVPYILCTSRNYFSRGEVDDIVNLVLLLSEPENPKFLAGWIASPFSGATPEEVAVCFGRAERQRAGREALQLAPVVKEKLPRVWKNLERLRKLALLKGASFAILDLLRRPDFLLFYEPKQRRNIVANLTRLSSIAAEYESSEGTSLPAFADYLKIITLAEGQKEEPDVTDEDEDAVRVLTIHAAKGLEYPVVAVLCSDARNNRGSIFVSPRYGVGVSKLPSFVGERGGESTVTYLWHRDRDHELETAERERLYYVALTRARDKLFLCSAGGCDKKTGACKTDSFGAFMSSVLGTELAGKRIEPDYADTAAPKVFDQRCEAEPPRENTALELAETYPAMLGRLSASAYAMLTWCPKAYRITYRQGRNLRWVIKSGEEQGGVDFGNIAHWILARWDFREESLGDWLPQTETETYRKTWRSLPLYLREIFSNDSVRDELTRMLSSYATSADGAKMAALAATGKLQREIPFHVLDESLMLIGTVDIMWEDEDAVHIRDWKTAAAETAPDEYYDRQLELYAYAVWRFRKSRGLSDKTITVALNYLRTEPQNKQEVFYGGEELQRVGERIRSVAVLALSGVFADEPGRCEKCPWRSDCSPAGKNAT